MNRINNLIMKSKKSKLNNILIFILFILQSVGITLAILVNQSIKDVTIYLAISFIIISTISNIFLPKITKGDQTFILLVNLLYTISLIMMIRLNNNISRNHILWYFIGLFVYIVSFNMMNIFDNFFKDKFILFFIITLGLFIITLVFGKLTGGAKNWIKIGPISVQPSEFAKISFTFMIASYYFNYEKYTKMSFGKYYLVVATYIFTFLFFIQGELGTAILFFGIFISSMFVFEKRIAFIISNLLLGLIGIYLASLVLGHIKVRFNVWLDPWSDANNKGYQIIQGLFSIANGGFFGSGIGLGRPDFIPVVESDYILAAIMEEMGIFLGFSIILIYIMLFYKSIKVSLEFNNKYYSSIALTIGLIYSLQALIMFGGILKLIPLTGITTPFLSYGGSSTISNFILLGILQYLTRRIGNNYEKHNE